MGIKTRYFWKELTDEGIFVDAEWANAEGYEHSDAAVVHMHLRFSTDTYTNDYICKPKWHLMKFYGVVNDNA